MKRKEFIKYIAGTSIGLSLSGTQLSCTKPAPISVEPLSKKIALPKYWVWSPIGYVNMHKPEVWGYVQFANDPSQIFKEESEEKIKWALWQMYYQVKECYSDLGKDCRLPSLAIPNVKIENYNFSPQLNANEFGFTISADSVDGSLLVIDERAQLKKQ